MNPTNLLPFFDPYRPVYIKQESVQLDGKIRKRGELYDWQRFGVPIWKMQQLFANDFIHHNAALEETTFKEVATKDLEDMNIAELHIYIDKLNEKFRPKVRTNSEFNKKKCPKVPKDTELQVRKIKHWRLTFGHLLD